MQNMQIDLYEKLQNPIDAIDRIGEMFAKSGMFGCEKIEQGKILAMVCLAERKSPIQIAREYHIIEGKLSDRADAMLAKFKACGGKYRVLHRTSERAEVEMVHQDQTITFGLTFEEVKQEPFVWMNAGKELKKNWRTPRARMQTLWARVVSDGVRTLAPEIVSGIYTPEELLDDAPAGGSGQSLDLGRTTTAAQSEQLAIEVKSEIVQEHPKTQVQSAQTAAPSQPAQPSQPAHQESKMASKAPVPMTVSPGFDAGQVENAIGEHAVVAVKWMLKNGWLQPGQSIADLTASRANRIIKQGDSFLRAVLAQDQPQTTPAQ